MANTVNSTSTTVESGKRLAYWRIDVIENLLACTTCYSWPFPTLGGPQAVI